MERQRFDDLARAIGARAGAGSRRALLGGIAGAALAGLLGREEAGAQKCPKKKERCGGKCVPVCRGDKLRDRATCECRCPDGMHACGAACVGDDRCCPGEKECGGGCIAEDACCTRTHKECPDGSCLEKGSGQCCPGSEIACPVVPDGCCNGLAGEECADDGCCNTLIRGIVICDGQCTDTDIDRKHCGGCGKACGPCETCEDGQCRSQCAAGKECCAGSCVAAGTCCGGKVACFEPYTQCCTGGSVPGHEVACCYPQPLDYCKVGPTGWATCSSNP